LKADVSCDPAWRARQEFTEEARTVKPVLAAAATTQATDDELVAATRAGSDEALETLFERYRDRITAYVRGMVSDHGRAEDIVQETFISALRSLRSSERPIIFRPWIYQIAKNASIDQFRRQQRAEEISLDSEDFKPSYEGRLSEGAPSIDSTVSQREEMHTLQQAFGGLPPSQHEVLVLREFAGLSYAEIARRMRLSTAAVESVLFRARRGLKDEYDEIATGKRCRQVQTIIAALAEGVGGARDRRALASHVGHCAGCRQEAVAMGLGALVRAERRSRVRRALDKAAALLPIPPFFGRRNSGASGAPPAGQIGGRAQSALSNFGSIAGPGAEQATLLSKAVAGLAAAVLIGGGALVGENSATGSDLPRSTAVAGAGLGGLGPPGGPGQSLGPATGNPNGPLGSLGGLLQSSEGSSAAFSPSLGGGGPAAAGQGVGIAPPGAGNAGALVTPGDGQSPAAGIVDGVRRTAPQDGSGSLPLNLPSVPRVGGGSGSGSGGGSSGGGLPSVPDSPSVPIKPPPVSKPSLPSPSPAPTVPSVPSVPSTPSVPSVPSVDSLSGTLEGATGGTPSLPNPSLPSL
jgi:RNA polymerase sigma factor (sigma-70 family)